MKRMWAALLLCGALSLTIISAIIERMIWISNQLRAIKVRRTQWSAQHPGKAITDAGRSGEEERDNRLKC
jgi:hypothetical protein